MTGREPERILNKSDGNLTLLYRLCRQISEFKLEFKIKRKEKGPPRAPPAALCMWLEHRPQCSTSSKRQMGVSHGVAVMERNYPAEYCPPTHTTSSPLDARYSPKHNFSLLTIALFVAGRQLEHKHDRITIE